MLIKKGFKNIGVDLNNAVEEGYVTKDEFITTMVVITEYNEDELEIIFDSWMSEDPIKKIDKLSYNDKFKEWFLNL